MPQFLDVKPLVFHLSLAKTLFCFAIRVVTGTTKMGPYSHLSFTPPALQESENWYQSSAQQENELEFRFQDGNDLTPAS